MEPNDKLEKSSIAMEKSTEETINDSLQFTPITEFVNNDLHLNNLNNIFKDIFDTLSSQNSTIKQLKKEKEISRTKYENQRDTYTKTIDELKNEIKELKNNTIEMKSRMVTRSDLLTQEIRMNKTASLNDLDEVRM